MYLSKDDLNERLVDGLEPVYPGSLSLADQILVLVGFGRRKQLWILHALEQSLQTGRPETSDVVFGQGRLFELAISVFLLAIRSSVVQATSFLGTQSCRICTYLRHLRQE